MNKDTSLRIFIKNALDNISLRTSRPNALILLAILSTIAGVATGLVVVSFRLLVETAQQYLLPYGATENYEGLPISLRILLPVVGAILIALIFRLWSKGDYIVGVSHVMERLSYHQGYIYLRGLILQYIGAAIAIISGQSLGREGPSIHLGAATSSMIGQYLKLPNNTIRTLVACGTAAAIGASFNTPLAGVIFALEVVMMEYTLASFMPVILAAVSATAVSHSVFGAEQAFLIPKFQPINLYEIPVVLIVGIITGIAATFFIFITKVFAKAGKKLSIWTRFITAGMVTGLLAISAPQIMGIGYDTINDVLINNIELKFLLVIFFAKVIATACSTGMGLPAGLIGPTFVIGACLGGILGLVAQQFLPPLSSSPGMYALIGMAAMMGATLQAPLAALTAAFELTGNPNIIWPGMLAIVTAQLTASQLFRQRSIYRMLMRLRGMDYQHEPMQQALRRIGVIDIMNKKVKRSPRLITKNQAEKLIETKSDWIVIVKDVPSSILPTSDLAKFLLENTGNEIEKIDLIKIPAKRLQVGCVDLRSTADDIRDEFRENSMEALCVSSIMQSGGFKIYGVLTKKHFQSLYNI